MKALSVKMKFVFSLLVLISAATTTFAGATAIFYCEVVSATGLAVADGREEFSGSLKRYVGDQIKFRIVMDRNQIDVSSESDDHNYFSEGATRTHQINAYDSFIFGGGYHGGFNMSDNNVDFFTSEGDNIRLNRYYKNDFDGVFVRGHRPWMVSTFGLNCENSKYDLHDFINFYKTLSN